MPFYTYDSGGTASGMVSTTKSEQPVEPDPEHNTPLDDVVDTIQSKAAASIQQVPPTSAGQPGNFIKYS